MLDQSATIKLSADEALVLRAFLERGDKGLSGKSAWKKEAERTAIGQGARSRRCVSIGDAARRRTVDVQPDDAERAFRIGPKAGDFAAVHGGELAVLWRLEGALEGEVVPSADTDLSYRGALAVARERLAEQAGTQGWRSLLGAGPP